ncbi:MAG TPA: hypothetical protein VMX97_03980, partial [Hyphomicrobiaceae bacterium]|nr:hypothetical protein [Hyphomicrobiaceae bacterium]
MTEEEYNASPHADVMSYDNALDTWHDEGRTIAPRYGKEPWEMTSDEYRTVSKAHPDWGGAGALPLRVQGNPTALIEDTDQYGAHGAGHKWAVEWALENQKPVPAEVLAEYPDLAEKAPEAVLAESPNVALAEAAQTFMELRQQEKAAQSAMREAEAAWQAEPLGSDERDARAADYRAAKTKADEANRATKDAGQKWADLAQKAPKTPPEATKEEKATVGSAQQENVAPGAAQAPPAVSEQAPKGTIGASAKTAEEFLRANGYDPKTAEPLAEKKSGGRGAMVRQDVIDQIAVEPDMTDIDAMLDAAMSGQTAQRIISDERVAEARARLQATPRAPKTGLAGRRQGEAGFADLDARRLKDLVTIGLYHVESLARSAGAKAVEFKSWAKEMIADQGDEVQPHLRHIWEAMGASRDVMTAVAAGEPPKPNDMDTIERTSMFGKHSPPPPQPPADPDPAAEAPADDFDVMDQWLADRQEHELEIDIRARNHMARVAEIAGERNYGVKARRLSAAMQLYIDTKGKPDQIAEHGGSLTPAQLSLYRESQTLPAAAHALAEQIIIENAAEGAQLLDAGVIHNVQENYLGRKWNLTPEAEPRKGQAKFKQSTMHAKARTLDSILHGWALGLQLKTVGAVEAQAAVSQEAARVLHDKAMIKTGLKAGIFTDSYAPETKQVLHPNFTHYRYAGTVALDLDAPIAKGARVRPFDSWRVGTVVSVNGDVVRVRFRPNATGEEAGDYRRAELATVQPTGKNFIIGDDGTILERVPVYAPKEVAARLNNILGQSALYSIPGIKWVTRWNAEIKANILFTSLFHHQAYLRSYMLASPGLNPVQGYQMGQQAIENFEPRLRELVRAGLTIFRIQDYDAVALADATTIGKVLDKIPMAAETKAWLVALREQQTRFLFERLGPNLKVAAALLEYAGRLKANESAIRDGKITPEEIAKAVAGLVNDDFGGLNLERMGRNPTLQHLFRLLALAPDWTESNMRHFAKMFAGGETGKV